MDIPPPWVKYDKEFPGLWKKDRSQPYWMVHGPDGKWHWEFHEHWKEFFKGDGESWWQKYVPKPVRDRIDSEVRKRTRQMEIDLRKKEDDLMEKIMEIRTHD